VRRARIPDVGSAAKRVLLRDNDAEGIMYKDLAVIGTEKEEACSKQRDEVETRER